MNGTLADVEPVALSEATPPPSTDVEDSDDEVEVPTTVKNAIEPDVTVVTVGLYNNVKGDARDDRNFSITIAFR